MIDRVAVRRGGRWDRRYLRVAIWAGLLVYAVYLSSAAWAGTVSETAGHVGRWVAQVSTTDESAATTNESAATTDEPKTIKVRGGSLAASMFASKDERLAFQRPTLADPRDEISCLALNIYFEARGESDKGKLAVSHVVMNRVLSDRFPSTVCEVIQQGGEIRRYRCQFSWWCDGLSDKPRSKQDWQRSSEIALAVYWGQTSDPTGGALWYHADYVSPAWRNDFVQVKTIGRHIFYKEKPNRRYRLASD
jgi:spore germination cell wall hydrolase CwlJ-like protein